MHENPLSRTIVFMKRTYLDYAAASPTGKAALRAYTKANLVYGNPSAPHQEGREAKAILEEARSTIARLAGMKVEQVYFTGSATEANNLALLGHGQKAPKGARFLYNAGAHASIKECMGMLERYGFPTAEIPLKDGALDLTSLRALITPETTMVSLEAISSETGVRFDTRKVRHVLDEVSVPGQKIWLHVDASQLPLTESFERTRLGADLITLDAQKVGAVRGIASLLAVSVVPLAPIVHGGGQERGLRSGTPSPALAAAFAAALEECAKEREKFVERSTRLRSLLVTEIETIEKLQVNEGKQQALNILNVSLIGRDTDYLCALLDEDGFAVSTRSACETDSEEGSRAVLALTGDETLARSTLRISFGNKTTEGDVQRFSKALETRVAFLDQHAL